MLGYGVCSPTTSITPMNEAVAELDVRPPVGGAGGLHRRRYWPNLAAARSWFSHHRRPWRPVRPGRSPREGGKVIEATIRHWAKLEVVGFIVWAELVWNLVIQ